ncbi:hypothetical protein ABK040_000089 [Willaertia magna]
MSLAELLQKRLQSIKKSPETETFPSNSQQQQQLNKYFTIGYFIGTELNAEEYRWKKFKENFREHFMIKQVTGKMICEENILNNEIDILYMPGGYPNNFYEQIGGDTAREKIQTFLLNPNKVYLGICAGCYLATCQHKEENEKMEFCINTFNLIENIKIKDRGINHIWKRGLGQCKLKFTESGKKIFKSVEENCEMFYRNGPVLEIIEKEGDIDGSDCCEVLATYENEFVTNETQKGIMIGSPAAIYSRYKGNGGKILLFSPHPEASVDIVVKYLIDGLLFCCSNE